MSRLKAGITPFRLEINCVITSGMYTVLWFFYDSQGAPIDVDIVEYRGVIPSGLAKRVTIKVDGSVQKLTTPYGSMTPKTKIEFRVLDFQIVN